MALLHRGHDPAAYESLTRRHRLEIVYTVHTDAVAVLAALIAVQHALDHLADAVVIPHLGTLEPGTPWWVVTEAADLITGTQEYLLWSAVTAQQSAPGDHAGIRHRRRPSADCADPGGGVAGNPAQAVSRSQIRNASQHTRLHALEMCGITSSGDR